MLMNRSSDVLQVLLETCIMQFISPNTNNCTFEYKTSEVKARLWVQQMACWTRVKRLVFPLQGCHWPPAWAAWAQARPLQHKAAMLFEHCCAEPCNAKTTWCSHRRALMVLAEADPYSQHLSPTSAGGLCLWQGWWGLLCWWSPKQR